MIADSDRGVRRWKWIAAIAMAVAGFTLLFQGALTRQTDERLIGTWQSDADRTVAAIRESRPVDDRQEAALRKLYGKMRVTYRATTYSVELHGSTTSYGYEVLGRDKHSVVIREIRHEPSPLDGIFELSEFAVIQFEGPDCYWVHSQIAQSGEYFKRIP